jgi:FAD/FMN-containing dehydrogenase
MTNPAIAAFQSIVGRDHVLVDDDLRAAHETDWTGRYTGRALAVLRPATTDEVAAILRRCNDDEVAVIPQGGNTGLVGGGVPRSGSDAGPAVVLSLRRLTGLGPVDTSAQQVTAGAGVTLARWRDHARAAGLDAPIDFAARDSATIGGAIATNAGGSRVLRFGTMRRQVTGVEAVLAGGAVVGSLGGLPKETAGIHWPSLLAGSEGTLAVITQARLRLVPHFEHTATAMVSTRSVDDAVLLLSRLRAGITSLDAVEVVFPTAIALVSEHLGAPAPIDVGACVLVIDCADHHDPAELLVATLAGAPEVLDSAVATDSHQRSQLLRYRDRIPDAIAAASALAGEPVFKLDVAVPVESIDRLLGVAEAAAAADGALLVPFGHLAEGNVHLNHLGATKPQQIAAKVLAAAAELGGTISAEHGIGVAKTPWMPLIRTADELAAQRALSDALDPNRILNRGVIHPV